jgi:RNA ligase (TIGR02306 family)
MRALVSVRRVDSVHPIEGADAIERARVDGWDVVVKKEENYKSGDLTIFFEIDAALPLDGFFGFLANRSPKRNVNDKTCHVIRTAKLRGVVSQGLMVLPQDLFPYDEPILVEGKDLTSLMEDQFGVTKWEAPLPGQAGGTTPKGNFPNELVRKTDSERVQNLGRHWDDVQEYKWIASEKIDGTSVTFVNTIDGLIVCSRNWMLNDGENLYWNMAREYELADLMPIGTYVQGEIYGEGIQKNRLGVKGVHLGVFASGYVHGKDGDWVDLSLPWVPVYDLVLPATIDEAVEQANGIKSKISKDRLAEGIVWWTTSPIIGLGDRPNFKAISNNYLLKEKD